MGSIKVHDVFNTFEDAEEQYAKLCRKEPSVELWKCRLHGEEKYAAISRVKTPGRNLNIQFLEKLSGSCPECSGPAIVVWKKGEVKALKCLEGHGRKRQRSGRPELRHPVFLV